jgi:hypothetical protein
MGSNTFDILMREIFRHKRLMEHLQEENRELHRQLDDLREARGIYLDICGKRFVVTSVRTPPPALTSHSTPASTFFDELMMGQSTPPSTAFLNPEETWPASAKREQRTKEVEQMGLQGQLVDSFLQE